MVVPELLGDIIVGADFLKKFGGVIDFKRETVELCGEIVPSEIITNRVSEPKDKELNACYSFGLRVMRKKYMEGMSAIGARGRETRYTNSGLSSLGGVRRLCTMQAVETIPENHNEKHEYLHNIVDDYDVDADITEYIKSLNDLSDCQTEIVTDLFTRNKRVFSDKPGSFVGYEHAIGVIEDKPFVRRSYPTPLHLKPRVDKEIEKMVKMGIISRSSSEFCNPLRVVSKKNGDVRVCLDARYLNKIVIANNESPQQIEQLMIRTDGVQYLSTTDLVTGKSG